MPPLSQQDRFVALVDEHRKILFKIAGSYARQGADREDLVQEMVLQMWRSFERYDPEQRFSTWMYRVALNVAISFHRRETRRSRVIVSGDETLIELAAAPGEMPVEELDTLRRMIEGLNEFDRALVILYLDGNTYADIAAVLGISESNVGTKLSRIKQQLRTDYAGKETRHGTR
ncbi:MAG TPA: sigma-70 family RNA polymerase sigma factor [Candidatus Krumholzibacteria bacterium]|nr:sigma-70 family RNA polymerase sigma factor [Candidatus Krumholzibacteria bacterium]